MKTLIIISNSDQYKYMYFYAKSSSNRSSCTFVDRSAMITSLEWSECRQTCKTKFHLKTTFIVYRARYAIPTHAHTNTRATHIQHTTLSFNVLLFSLLFRISESLESDDTIFRLRYIYKMSVASCEQMMTTVKHVIA